MRPDLAALGREMHARAAELYPLCRSITGDGFRRSLDLLARHVPLERHEVPTGTPVLDWTVPREWNIRDAWLRDPAGKLVASFAESNLHVVNYSQPVDGRFTLEELRPHLHSLPDRPEWIPYRTSYYKEDWGFCLRHRQLAALVPGTYEARIDATLADGHLTYGELLLPGKTSDEVLVSCHSCHPSLANDNLSGMVLASELARLLGDVPRRYGYRFLFIPGTIGSITWLARNLERVGRIRHGLVVACVGDAGKLRYKASRRGDAEIDRVVRYVLESSGRPHELLEFTPYGYDERQYCSPGFDLAVGSLTRTPHGRYPEYHTSADDLSLIRADSLADSLAAYLEVVELLEANRTLRNTSPHGEPQLGRRGLYRAMGGSPEPGKSELAMLWLLNLGDGTHALLDVARRSGLPFALVRDVALVLENHGLLAAC